MGKTFGLNAVDWEQRVDVDRLRRQRLERIGGLLERSELGALLCFDMVNIRYITATHMPGEFNPQMFGGTQIEFPAVAKVERSFTPVIGGPAKQCEDNGGGAEVTRPDCGSRVVEDWAVDLQYAREKKNALLLSGGTSIEDPYVNCPGSSLATFPWLVVEKSGNKGKYIYAEVTQDELFAGTPAIGNSVLPTDRQVQRQSTYFQLLDADKDGVVTLAEFMAQADRNFARCDINKDGRIDTAECRQALQRRPAER